LAELLDVTTGAVTQLVDGLKLAGHVETTANPADARSRLIVLTPEAQAEVDRFESATAERLRPLFDEVSAAELAALAELLARVSAGARS
jgi:DNA-binding MarR family transcriptional regulator